jgi:hypothetical protein
MCTPPSGISKSVGVTNPSRCGSTETEAVLKNGADVTVLRLYPQVDKRSAGSGTGKSVTKTTK